MTKSLIFRPPTSCRAWPLSSYIRGGEFHTSSGPFRARRKPPSKLGWTEVQHSLLWQRVLPNLLRHTFSSNGDGGVCPQTEQLQLTTRKSFVAE